MVSSRIRESDNERVNANEFVDWQVGEDVIVPPTVSTDKAREKFADVREIRPYLRFTSGEMKN